MNAYKITISILFGLVGLFLNFNSITFPFPPYTAIVLIGLLFPLMVTIEFGWKYGSISASICCMSIWWILVGVNGYAALFVVPPFFLWILWHGYFAEIRKQRGDDVWWLSPYIVEIPFRILNTINLYTVTRWAVELNPPSWAPAASAVVPMEFTYFVIVKQIVSGYIILLLADVLLNLGYVRRFLRLEEKTNQVNTGYIISASILFGCLFWLADSVVSSIIFYSGHSFVDMLAMDIPPYVLYVRTAFIITCLVGGLIAASFLRRQRDSEQRYRLLADNTLDVIWKLDLDLTFTYVNPAVFDMVGFTPEEWVGSKLPEHCSHEDMQKIQILIEHEIDSRDKHRWVVFEASFFNKNGDGVPCEVSARILFDDNMIPISVQGTTRDITERKVAENNINRMLAELKRSNEDLEHFARVASHDLQEPIRTISGYMKIIKRKCKGKIDSDVDNYMDSVIDSVVNMQSLIRDLLLYSGVSTIGSSHVHTECDDLIDNAIANLRVSIDESGAVVTHDKLPNVMADCSQLSHVFQNLIGNAIKFRGDMPPRIHVSAEKKGDMWQFSVSDNGIGIDPKFFDRIFVAFQRLHNREKYSGTGIGLAICKRIIERHNGKIWLESEPGVGSTFYFTL